MAGTRLARATNSLQVAALGATLFVLRMPYPVQVPYGGVCGHAPGQAHCAVCYAAAAMVIIGVAGWLAEASRGGRDLIQIKAFR